MIGVVYSSQAAALGLQASLNLALGYPRPGVNVGDGRHVPAVDGQTLRCANLIAHPSGLQWALQESDDIQSAEAGVGIGAGVRVSLASDWWPASQVTAVEALADEP
jgi:hypothetical protein